MAGPHDCRCTLRPALHTVQSGMTIGRLLGPFLVECGLRTPHRICEPLRGGRLPCVPFHRVYSIRAVPFLSRAHTFVWVGATALNEGSPRSCQGVESGRLCCARFQGPICWVGTYAHAKRLKYPGFGFIRRFSFSFHFFSTCIGRIRR